VLTLWQAEWCPHSHRVRLRLTELGLDVVLRQVPVDREARDDMERETASRSIPTLVADGAVVSGVDEILAWLEQHEPAPTRGGDHRAKMREEWPHWVELEGGGP
jgi:glutathione S-transferase